MTHQETRHEHYTEFTIAVKTGLLEATLLQPTPAHGTILFAHGSGSSRHSPRNRQVAERLYDAGYAAILLDLLTASEDRTDQITTQWRFDIPMLANRLIEVIDWLPTRLAVGDLPLGLFGASTGAAAALIAAGRRPERVRAVVSRGGRPDLAGAELVAVRAPTLLLVGGLDDIVIELNREAASEIGELARVVIVPGASHLFSEPGTLEQVAEHAVTWFDRHLGGTASDGEAAEPPGPWRGSR